MIKRNRIKIIIASVIIFLPMILGAIFWNDLPESFATHWSIDGQSDGYFGKAFFVFAMPLILYALFWLCLLMTFKDPGNKEQSNKVLGISIWIMPFISVFVSCISYFASVGDSIKALSFMPVILGALFAVMGNYMPKCKQNSTIGIKIKWTLENEENWNKTHRFSGKIFVPGGLLMMLCCLLPDFLGLITALVIVLVSTVWVYAYSYAYYKKQKKEGSYTVKTSVKPLKKSAKIAIAVAITVILVGVAVLMFTGDVTVSIDGRQIIVDSTYYSETVFELDAVDTVQYVEDFDGGLRSSGFHSAKLALGNYENEKYKYLSYRYTNVDSCVVLFTDHGIIAINQPTEEATKALYDELLVKSIK